MTRILVTGATGFIGREVTAGLLAKGHAVHAVTSHQPTSLHPGIIWHQADLLDGSDLTPTLAEVQPSQLLHLAWAVPAGSWPSSPDHVRWLDASTRLVRAFLDAGGKRLVVAGSCAEYDLDYGYCSEALTPCRPSTLYGRCKNTLREFVECVAAASGVSAAWARIFYLYGPQEDPRRLVSSVIRSLLSNERPACTHGDQIRDYMHVTDVASALAAILDSDLTGAVNVASGKPISVRELVQTVERAMGRPGETEFGSIVPGAHDPPFVVGNPSLLRERTGWSQSIPVDTGVMATVTQIRTLLGRPGPVPYAPQREHGAT